MGANLKVYWVSSLETSKCNWVGSSCTVAGIKSAHTKQETIDNHGSLQLERWLKNKSGCFCEAEDLRSQDEASTAQSLGRAAFGSVAPPAVSSVSSGDTDPKA